MGNIQAPLDMNSSEITALAMKLDSLLKMRDARSPADLTNNEDQIKVVRKIRERPDDLELRERGIDALVNFLESLDNGDVNSREISSIKQKRDELYHSLGMDVDQTGRRSGAHR